MLVRKIALKFSFVDLPDGSRKIHDKPMPLLGGTAIFLSFWLVAGYFLFVHPVYGMEILASKMAGVFLASFILIVMGAVDDKKQLSPKLRLLITVVAALIAIGWGLGLEKITNPMGGILSLNFWPIQVGSGTFFLLADILIFIWLMGMMYTTKILDGLDGLSVGTVFIGAVVIFLLAISTKYYQPNVAILSLIFSASCLGFLLFNFYPSKIFLGEGGSLFIGLMLGVLAIISGGKVATALLVMAIPILDLARVAYVRIKNRQSIFKGDREHLHFRLLDAGFSHRRAVLLLYFLAFLFGITTLFLQSIQKLYALLVLVVLMAVISHYVGRNK
ncbi:MAG: Glycosyl transferase, family 4, conserved region [Candidatus Magasanikbacteria bacterium GW2011_GWA2_40_10]|uniref:Glycosyl transferase, family 4, conserved region n=1 Tax=Candidatus Magasanikbacteria bacterium GW2011_GWA2_40_10 TaxID=1619037 RepID=A0A0G0Q2Z1_9BACT|nr:MAG: Glycosyl transferase, family 4, conserved region [Candidatus Magasanikbacteria bacterium GW2011_GWA2_40_10]